MSLSLGLLGLRGWEHEHARDLMCRVGTMMVAGGEDVRGKHTG